MKFEIHGSINEYEDSIIIEGESIEEIKEIAKRETSKRSWTNCWSEQLE